MSKYKALFVPLGQLVQFLEVPLFRSLFDLVPKNKQPTEFDAVNEFISPLLGLKFEYNLGRLKTDEQSLASRIVSLMQEKLGLTEAECPSLAAVNTAWRTGVNLANGALDTAPYGKIPLGETITESLILKETTKNLLAKLAKAEKQGVEVYIFAYTNAMHLAWLKLRFAESGLKWPKHMRTSFKQKCHIPHMMGQMVSKLPHKAENILVVEGASLYLKYTDDFKVQTKGAKQVKQLSHAFHELGIQPSCAKNMTLGGITKSLPLPKDDSPTHTESSESESDATP